jgi:cell division protease FtsH
VPDYASILAAWDFQGITVESYAYLNARDECRTWRHLRHSLRISLAGRAAEELTCGREGFSTGCESDLNRATSNALLAFTRYGFDPDEDESHNGRCLAVFERESVTPSERARVEGVVRQFLAREYKHVLGVLDAHRQLLEAIAERLLEKSILHQQDVAELWRGFRVRASCCHELAAVSLGTGKSRN